MLLWLESACFWSTVYCRVGEPVEIRSAGAWIRVFPTEGEGLPLWVAIKVSMLAHCKRREMVSRLGVD